MDRTSMTGIMAAVKLLMAGLVLLGSILAAASEARAAGKQERPSQHRNNRLDHATLIEQADLERGRRIYREACLSCHGADGQKTINPQARAFGRGELRNGADPYSMFETLTQGYKTMPTMTWLSPQQRYDAIHYVRERFVKEKNPSEYVPITEKYLASLPKAGPGETGASTKSSGDRDFGGALSWRVASKARSGLTVDLKSQTTINYNLHHMGVAGVWTGGFLDLSNTMLEKKRAGGSPRPVGQPIPELAQWRWALNGSFDVGPESSNSWPQRGPAPTSWMEYQGRYVHGNQIVLAYRIGERKVLELPQMRQLSERPVLVHTLEIEAGREPMKLLVGASPAKGKSKSFRGLLSLEGKRVGRRGGKAAGHLVLAGSGDPNSPYRRFSAAAVAGNVKGLRWKVDDKTGLVLQIPGGDRSRVVHVMRYAGQRKAEMLQFASFARFNRDAATFTRPSSLTDGGARRWNQTITVEGKLGEARDGYALDTVPIPFKNRYNVWMRTAAVGFFSDGRAVVTTYTGDVWIVSGLDDDLDEVRWKRYAAGLYEPLGVQVVNGQIYVTCRDGIVRLHDLNQNGEADYYERFFADPNVRTHWHMFNFDLQVDQAGNFYYAKTGLFNDFTTPGAIMRVAPDGSEGERIATGFRVPNGMGMLPDGRPTVSDNEGGWIPASKISIVEKGAFYGYPTGRPPAGPNGEYRPPDQFKKPMIWMPQSLDASSGGQMWAEDDRFGPLADRLLHTSFNPGQMYYLLRQESDAGMVAAMIVALPHQFDAGIMRARQNPATGNVWATGLSGWQGPPGADDGCLQRLRYTGRGARIIDGFKLHHNGIELFFNFALDQDAAQNRDNYNLDWWNYRWSHNYGSAHYSVANPGEKGEEPVPISDVRVSDNGRRVMLVIKKLKPVDQLRIDLDLRDERDKAFTERVYMTIHRIPCEGVRDDY